MKPSVFLFVTTLLLIVVTLQDLRASSVVNRLRKSSPRITTMSTSSEGEIDQVLKLLSNKNQESHKPRKEIISIWTRWSNSRQKRDSDPEDDEGDPQPRIPPSQTLEKVKKYVQKIVQELSQFNQKFILRLIRMTAREDLAQMPELMKDFDISPERPIFFIAGGLKSVPLEDVTNITITTTTTTTPTSIDTLSSTSTPTPTTTTSTTTETLPSTSTSTLSPTTTTTSTETLPSTSTPIPTTTTSSTEAVPSTSTSRPTITNTSTGALISISTPIPIFTTTSTETLPSISTPSTIITTTSTETLPSISTPSTTSISTTEAETTVQDEEQAATTHSSLGNTSVRVTSSELSSSTQQYTTTGPTTTTMAPEQAQLVATPELSSENKSEPLSQHQTRRKRGTMMLNPLELPVPGRMARTEDPFENEDHVSLEDLVGVKYTGAKDHHDIKNLDEGYNEAQRLSGQKNSNKRMVDGVPVVEETSENIEVSKIGEETIESSSGLETSISVVKIPSADGNKELISLPVAPESIDTLSSSQDSSEESSEESKEVVNDKDHDEDDNDDMVDNKEESGEVSQSIVPSSQDLEAVEIVSLAKPVPEVIHGEAVPEVIHHEEQFASIPSEIVYVEEPFVSKVPVEFVQPDLPLDPVEVTHLEDNLPQLLLNTDLLKEPFVPKVNHHEEQFASIPPETVHVEKPFVPKVPAEFVQPGLPFVPVEITQLEDSLPQLSLNTGLLEEPFVPEVISQPTVPAEFQGAITLEVNKPLEPLIVAIPVEVTQSNEPVIQPPIVTLVEHPIVEIPMEAEATKQSGQPPVVEMPVDVTPPEEVMTPIIGLTHAQPLPHNNGPLFDPIVSMKPVEFTRPELQVVSDISNSNNIVGLASNIIQAEHPIAIVDEVEPIITAETEYSLEQSALAHQNVAEIQDKIMQTNSIPVVQVPELPPFPMAIIPDPDQELTPEGIQHVSQLMETTDPQFALVEVTQPDTSKISEVEPIVAVAHNTDLPTMHETLVALSDPQPAPGPGVILVAHPDNLNSPDKLPQSLEVSLPEPEISIPLTSNSVLPNTVTQLILSEVHPAPALTPDNMEYLNTISYANDDILKDVPEPDLHPQIRPPVNQFSDISNNLRPTIPHSSMPIVPTFVQTPVVHGPTYQMVNFNNELENSNTMSDVEVNLPVPEVGSSPIFHLGVHVAMKKKQHLVHYFFPNIE